VTSDVQLKGCPPDKLQAEVDLWIKEVGLEEKRHVNASGLSGGQKRRLSVAIALIFGSKVSTSFSVHAM
jgi:ABC-type multidrug transport system ATPase subunit